MSSRKLPLVFALEAQDDLDQIQQYTLEMWGSQQLETYSALLEESFERIQSLPTIGMQRYWLPDNYRAYQTGKHLIIYWPREEEIRIIRILHVNQDIGLPF